MGDHTIEIAGALSCGVFECVAALDSGIGFECRRRVRRDQDLQGVTFTVGRGDRWGILGRNGSGKTTLFRLITGTQQPTEGASPDSPVCGLALLEQHRDFGGAKTVWEAGAGEFADLLALEHSLAEQGNSCQGG